MCMSLRRAIEDSDDSRRQAGFVELERHARISRGRRELFDAATQTLRRALETDLVEIVELEGNVWWSAPVRDIGTICATASG